MAPLHARHYFPQLAEGHLTRPPFWQIIGLVTQRVGHPASWWAIPRVRPDGVATVIVNEGHLWSKCDPRHGASRGACGGGAAQGHDGFVGLYGGGLGQSCSPSRWPLHISWRHNSVSS